jgi:hypothetical protein
MGIFIGPDASRVTVVAVTAKDMWGDGFYVGGATDVAFCSVVARASPSSAPSGCW